MAKKQIKQNKFYGGVSDDIREESNIKFARSENFDIHTFTDRLTPLPKLTEDGNSYDEDYQVRKFVYDPENDDILGLGVPTSGSPVPKILAITSPLGTGAWSAPASAEGGGANLSESFVFQLYKDYIYLFPSVGVIDRYGPLSGGKTYSTSYKTFTGATSTGPAIVGKDDVLYFPYTKANETGIASLDSGGTLAQPLTIPDHYIIRQLAWYDDYLAFVAESTDVNEESIIGIWDYISADPIELVKIGQSKAKALANLDRTLIAASTNTEGVLNKVDDKIIFTGWNGGDPYIIKEIISEASNTTIDTTFRSNEGKLYIGLTTGETSTDQFGLWQIGRKSENFPLAFCQYLTNSNFGSGINDFLHHEQEMILSAGTSPYEVFRLGTTYIDTQANLAILESQKFVGSDPSIKKTLHGVVLTYDPLPSSCTITLKYRKNEDSAWTTIFTETTANAIYTAKTHKTSGTNITDWNEIQFRIESKCTGGRGQITGFRFTYEEHADEI